MEVERTNIDSADSDSSTDFYMPGYVDPTDLFSVKYGMFLLSSSMERQKAPAHHLIFADAEIVGHPDDYTEAELRLATKTKALFFNQHNCQFAWGLTMSNCTIHAYKSTAMDISGEKGRQVFVLLLVNWLLCPINHLGFDPSIRYVVGSGSGGPYLEVDVHKVDRSAGKVEPRTYYSQWCLGATDRLTRCHARYFAVSASPRSIDKPAFLIKDVWMTTCSGSADNTHKRLFLNVLHAEFNKSSEFSNSFVQLVSTGPVFINRGNTVITDSTATAFVGLPSTIQDAAKDSNNTQGSSNSCVCQHRCTVAKWTRNMIFKADSESQVIVAVTDAMVALNAVYVKCNILHGNISNRAIWLQKMAKGVKGVLAEFDYAFYAGANAVEALELMLFQSMHSLDNPRVTDNMASVARALMVQMDNTPAML
ncbi:hypothetical protein H4S03_001938 [Coemansia sp. S3946]|nr:hypothetical protein H4S03_001938 [Coemansia sp. S3946]